MTHELIQRTHQPVCVLKTLFSQFQVFLMLFLKFPGLACSELSQRDWAIKAHGWSKQLAGYPADANLQQGIAKVSVLQYDKCLNLGGNYMEK